MCINMINGKKKEKNGALIRADLSFTDVSLLKIVYSTDRGGRGGEGEERNQLVFYGKIADREIKPA